MKSNEQAKRRKSAKVPRIMKCNVSVIIPIYNAEKYVGMCLDSLLAQSEDNMEIICVNDGSKDGTEKILEYYKSKDKRIKVIKQENKGAGAARNLGFSYAEGKYSIFLDSDDIFEKNMLSDMFKIAESSGADTVICLADSFSDKTGKIAAGWTMPIGPLEGEFVFSPYEKRDCLFQLVQGWPWDKMFRTDRIKEFGIRYPDLPNSQDLVFVFQALVLSRRIAVLNKVMVHRRIHNENSISNSRALYWKAPLEAVEITLSEFEKHDIMRYYRESFNKWVLGFLRWHIGTLPNPVRKECYCSVKNGWFSKMNLLSADIHPNLQRLKFIIIRNLPYRMYVFLKMLKNRAKNILKKGMKGNVRNKTE